MVGGIIVGKSFKLLKKVIEVQKHSEPGLTTRLLRMSTQNDGDIY
jgi:hypothetical protein